MALPGDPSRLILTDADITRPGPLADALGGLGAGVGLPGYDIIVIAGQSNAAGSGEPFSAALDPETPTIDQYGAKVRTIRPASEPLDMVNATTGMGPGLQFARWYASQLTPGRKVLIVPAAKGGTRLCSDTGESWRATRPTPSLYAAAIEQTQEAIMAAGPGTHRVVTVLWLQGEADSAQSTSPATYRTDLDNLIDAFRADLDDPNLPFIIGPMVHEWVANGSTGAPAGTAAQIRDVQADTPNRKPRTGYVPATADMPHDPDDVIHWPGPAQRIIGRRMAHEWQRVNAGGATEAPSDDTGWVNVDWLSTLNGLTIDAQQARRVGSLVHYRLTGTISATGSNVGYAAGAVTAGWRPPASIATGVYSYAAGVYLGALCMNAHGTILIRATAAGTVDLNYTWGAA